MPNHGDAYSTLIKNLPGSEETILNVAKDLLRERKFTEGGNFLNRVIGVHSSVALVILRAQFWRSSGQNQDAIASLVGLLRQNDTNIDTLICLVECLIEAGEYTRARKMLVRTKSLGGARDERAELLGAKLDALEGKTGKISGDIIEKRRTAMGMPNSPFSVSGMHGDSGAEIELSDAEDPTIESGTFADLAAYLSHTEKDETINQKLKIGTLGDQRFDSVLDAMGVSVPTQPFERAPISRPNDPTSGLNIDIQGSAYAPTASGLFTSAPKFQPDADTKSSTTTPERAATPEDKTEFIVLRDSLHRNVASDKTEFLVLEDQKNPHVDTNASDKTEFLILKEDVQNPNAYRGDDMPTGHMLRNDIDDDEPTAHLVLNDEQMNQINHQQPVSPGLSFRPNAPIEEGPLSFGIPPKPSVPESYPSPDPAFNAAPLAPVPIQNEDYLPKLQSAEIGRPIGRAVDIGMQSDSIPFAQGLSSGEMPSYAPSPSFSEANPPYPEPRTPKAASPFGKTSPPPKPRPLKSKTRAGKIPIILGVMVLVFGVAMLALLGIASYQRMTFLRDNFSAVRKAMAPDDYNGYLLAKKTLAKGIAHHSFLGSGLDSAIQALMPISSLDSKRIETEHLSLLAFTDALLEARFESLGSQNAKESLKDARSAAKNHPGVVAARALHAFTEGRPYEALDLLESSKDAFPNAMLFNELRVQIAFSLGQFNKAHQAGAPLRTKKKTSIREQYYAALSLTALHDRSAMHLYSEILDKNPNHLDALIDRSLLLRDGASEVKRAETELLNLPREASQYQAARATIAFGHLLLAKQDLNAAEEKFRRATQKMPTRTELYKPLLDFYFDQGRYSDAQKVIEKVGKDGQLSTQLSLIKAEILVLTSQYQNAIAELEKTPLKNAEKNWIRGFAYFHQGLYEKALSELAKAKEKDPSLVRAAAFREISRSFLKSEATEDVLHRLGSLKNEFPNDPFVNYALAKVRIRDAMQSSSKSKRKSQFLAARKELKKSIKSKRYPLFYYELCKLNRLELNYKSALENCAAGRKIAPDYLPGQLNFARLRVDQGAYKDAQDIVGKLKMKHPDNVELGLLAVRIDIGEHKSASARKELNKWIGRSGADPFELYLLDGRLRFSKEAYTRAVGFFEKAYKLKPGNAENATFYANTLVRLGNPKKAIAILKDAKHHPVWRGLALIVEGESYRKSGKATKAIKSLDSARAFFKKNRPPAETYSVLFTERALAKQKQWGWADPRVRKEFELVRRRGDIDHPYFNLNYARFHMAQKRPDENEIRKALQRVIKVIPGNCYAITNLIQIYRKRRPTKITRKKLKQYRNANQKHCQK